MPTRIACGLAGLALVIVGCQNITAPQQPDDSRPAITVRAPNLQTGPSNQCRGAAVSEFASDWPWPETRAMFPPPPGAIKLFIENFGPLGGFSSVRELQEFFCAD